MENANVEAIGRNIRLARRSARLTQRDLGDLVGVSERTVREIESGSGKPSVASVIAAANAVGLEVYAK